MEAAKRVAREQGEDEERLGATSGTDRARNDTEEKIEPGEHPGANAASEAVKDEEAVSVEQTESGDNTGEGREPKNDSKGGKVQRIDTQDHDDGATFSSEEGNSLLEHPDRPIASPNVSEMSQDQRVTTTESSQNQPDSENTAADASDSSHKQTYNSAAYLTASDSPPEDDPNSDVAATKLSQGQHSSPYVNAAASDSSGDLHCSSGTSSTSSSSPEDCSDPECQTSASAQEGHHGTGSGSKTNDSLQNNVGDNDLRPSTAQMPKHIQTQHQDDTIQISADDTAQASTKSGDLQCSSTTPPLTINYEALKHIATYFLPVSHGACIDIRSIEGGTFHEVEVLTFADGWTCIGRFAREEERLYKVESELATMEYVRTHTQIPVPEVYFVNHNRNHVVGAAFVLMERMKGFRLNDIWYELTMEHQFSVLEKLAQMLEQLAGLHFDQIGSLTAGGKVGPLVNLTRNLHEPLLGPFSNTLDFFLAGVESDVLRDGSEGTKALWPAIEVELRARFARETTNPTLNPPYRLIHDDLEFFNILVTHDDKDLPPKISAIIDWDWAYTGPLHYLCEYPPPTIGYAGDGDEKPKEKLLRKHFVKALMQRYPKNSADRENVKRCFREKSVELRSFVPMFTNYNSENIAPFNSLARSYLSNLQRDDELDDYHPYGICEEWIPDSEPESDDD